MTLIYPLLGLLSLLSLAAATKLPPDHTSSYASPYGPISSKEFAQQRKESLLTSRSIKATSATHAAQQFFQSHAASFYSEAERSEIEEHDRRLIVQGSESLEGRFRWITGELWRGGVTLGC